MNKILYNDGRQAVIDILNYRIVKSKKIENNLINLLKIYESKKVPTMPVNADLLMSKYQIPEGKQLGFKLKRIEEEWIKNNFKISNQQIDNIVNN